jgi:dipeptide transport system permease protein
MIRYVLSKILYLVPTMLGILIVAFGFIRLLPGDPVLLMAGERGVSPERYAELAAQLGYDRPVWAQ